MRCARCGRLPEGEAPKWAFHCVCDPCVSCPLRDRLQDDQGGCLESTIAPPWRTGAFAHDEAGFPHPRHAHAWAAGEGRGRDVRGPMGGTRLPRLLAWVDPS